MIEINNEQRLCEISQKIRMVIESAITCALVSEGFERPYEVNVILTDNDGIRQMNNAYRNIDKPTDVLSFPMLSYKNGVPLYEGEDDLDPETGGVLLGDIVVSIERAKEQAKDYDHSFEREIGFLVVHSMFHLLGYDHMDDIDQAIMRRKEEAVLIKLGLSR